MGDEEWWRDGGGHGERIAFSFSPFSFALADSEKLMKAQYDNLLFCYFMLSTVLSGLGSYGMVAELSQLQHRTCLLWSHCECLNLKSLYFCCCCFVFSYVDVQYV